MTVLVPNSFLVLTRFKYLVSGSAENVEPETFTHEGAKKFLRSECSGLNPRVLSPSVALSPESLTFAGSILSKVANFFYLCLIFVQRRSNRANESTRAQDAAHQPPFRPPPHSHVAVACIQWVPRICTTRRASKSAYRRPNCDVAPFYTTAYKSRPHVCIRVSDTAYQRSASDPSLPYFTPESNGLQPHKLLEFSPRIPECLSIPGRIPHVTAESNGRQPRKLLEFSPRTCECLSALGRNPHVTAESNGRKPRKLLESLPRTHECLSIRGQFPHVTAESNGLFPNADTLHVRSVPRCYHATARP